MFGVKRFEGTAFAFVTTKSSTMLITMIKIEVRKREDGDIYGRGKIF
jgi:hypothetical protein